MQRRTIDGTTITVVAHGQWLGDYHVTWCRGTRVEKRIMQARSEGDALRRAEAMTKRSTE